MLKIKLFHTFAPESEKPNDIIQVLKALNSCSG